MIVGKVVTVFLAAGAMLTFFTDFGFQNSLLLLFLTALGVYMIYLMPAHLHRQLQRAINTPGIAQAAQPSNTSVGSLSRSLLFITIELSILFASFLAVALWLAFVVFGMFFPPGASSQPASISISVPEWQQRLTSSSVGFRADVVGLEEPLQYQWDFGDGSDISEDKSPSHVFKTGGFYRAAVVVTDRKGRVAHNSIEFTIDRKPVTAFRSQPYPASGEAPFEIYFINESSDDDRIIDFLWDFGDGITSLEQDPNHTYLKPGRYTVRLKATDSINQFSFFEQLVEVRPPMPSFVPPVPSFRVVSPTPIAGESVVFDASGSFDQDGVIIDYIWDFNGDGNFDLQTQSPSTSWNYRLDGPYVVTLSTVDDDSLIASVEHEIAVHPNYELGFGIGTWASICTKYVVCLLPKLTGSLLFNKLHEVQVDLVPEVLSLTYQSFFVLAQWTLYPFRQPWELAVLGVHVSDVLPYIGLIVSPYVNSEDGWIHFADPYLSLGFKTELQNLSLFTGLLIYTNGWGVDASIVWTLF